MEPAPRRRQPIAVDANFLFDLADGLHDATDAYELLVRRVPGLTFILSPTVQHELAHLATAGRTPAKRATARKAIQLARERGMQPRNLSAVEMGIAEQVARRPRVCGLIPEPEVHDSFLPPEAALLGCRMLVTADAHLLEADFARLSLEMSAFDLDAPVIASPHNVVKKFFR
jgi:predicted nucleic acid-binding protein